MTIRLPEPELQVTFARILAELRGTLLQDALRVVVAGLSIPDLDGELARIVPGHSLSLLAGHGLRGELMFATPIVLRASPKLLGYYRLLYGYSQKEFYKPHVAGRFKPLEVSGNIPSRVDAELPLLCEALSASGSLLLANLKSANPGLLDDLTLLTLGAQLRGSSNVRIGQAATAAVFDVIKSIVRHAIVATTATTMEIKNAAGRTVRIALAADPDIVILETMPSGTVRNVVAMEVKGGKDFSNVHNRVGEAEKSHQKARAKHFTECWTVVNVDNIDLRMAKQESPSTDRFYKIPDLVTAKGPDYEDFRERILALTNIS